MKRKPKNKQKTAILPALPQDDVCSCFEAAVLSNISPCLSGQNTVFLLALSGGADSTALAAAMAALRDKAADSRGFSLYCLHVNHGLRSPEESANDEKVSAALCKKLDIPFSVTVIPPGAVEAYAKKNGTGIEGAARHFRHAALRREALRLGAGATCIAHTASDRLETILMAFLRGSGPSGLGAMPGYSDNNTAHVDGSEKPATTPSPIARPLISLDRADVLAYLEARNLAYCNDATNTDEHFLRNKVRLTLIPFLDKHFNGWRTPVLRLGETQAMTADFLKNEAERMLPWQKEKACLLLHQKEAISASAECFFALPPILREEALYGAIDCLVPSLETVKKPRRETLRSFVQKQQKAADAGVCRLEHKKDRIIVQKTEKSACNNGFSVLIKSQGVYKLKALTITVSSTQEQSPIAGEKTGFFANLPFVLRSGDNGTIFAEDRQGRAAMINGSGLVQSGALDQKQTGANQNIVYCVIQLSGGWDVPGTEQ